MEEDETPCVFENDLQAEEALMDLEVFASRSGYPPAIVRRFGDLAHQMRVHRVNKRTSSTSLILHGFSKKPRTTNCV